MTKISKSDMKPGQLVTVWQNYVGQGATFLAWVDGRMAQLLLGDGSKIVVNGSTFDVVA